MHVVLQDQEASGEPREPATDPGGDQIDAALIDTHQPHDIAILRNRPDRGAEIGAREEVSLGGRWREFVALDREAEQGDTGR